MAENDLYERLVAAADAISGGSRPGTRALHAKGAWCEGTFTATPEAAALSRAFHLSGEPIAALIRFSNGPGDPEADDAEREARGFAVKLRGGDGDEPTSSRRPRRRSSPARPRSSSSCSSCAARTPRPASPTSRSSAPSSPPTRRRRPRSRAPWASGRSPASPPASTTRPTPSGSSTTPAGGAPVRDALAPRGGRAAPRGRRGEGARPRLPLRGPGRAPRGGRDDRLRASLPAPGADDPLDDPTALWPDEREFVDAGRLEITAAVEDPERDDHIDVFDPLRLPDGVEPSDDPILHARRNAYSVSAYRRWGRPPGPPPE